jgi:hypothetical protein
MNNGDVTTDKKVSSDFLTIRLDKRQGVSPAGPQTRQPDPEETVGGMETGTRDGPLIDGDLVAEGDDFKLQSQTRTE